LRKYFNTQLYMYFFLWICLLWNLFTKQIKLFLVQIKEMKYCIQGRVPHRWFLTESKRVVEQKPKRYKK